MKGVGLPSSLLLEREELDKTLHTKMTFHSRQYWKFDGSLRGLYSVLTLLLVGGHT